MSKTPLNEILVIITNVVLRSETGQRLFTPDERGENNFAMWQSNLLNLAQIIHDEWDSTDERFQQSVHESLDVFERLFKTPFKLTTSTTSF